MKINLRVSNSDMALLLRIAFYLLIVATVHGTVDQPNLLERLLQNIIGDGEFVSFQMSWFDFA